MSPDAPLVLVADDDRAVRHALQTFLEMHGFTVMTADTADAAIEAIHHHRPAAAIVDLRLARGSGRDVAIAMPASAPVIIFTRTPAESAELERLRPRTRLVAKPHSLLLVIEALGEMLDGARQPV